MSGELIESIAPLRERVARARRNGQSIGFVPTMGALHAGHASLIDRARLDSGVVVVSIFVNPLQFDREDDLARYPRTLDADLRLCASHGADAVFAPTAAEMFAVPPQCTVEVGTIAAHLCGRFRPGHFRGVATVVMKLFGIVQADAAYFGEKDMQQLAIIRRLAVDLNVPITIVGVPTVREADGLAISSRNVRLNPTERGLAPALYRALRAGAAAIESGDHDVGRAKALAAAGLPDDPRLRLEYLEIVDPETVQPLERIEGPAAIAGALWVGATRLIDNVAVRAATGQ
jgi:pantoate--beta-alanine ligase